MRVATQRKRKDRETIIIEKVLTVILHRLLRKLARKGSQRPSRSRLTPFCESHCLVGNSIQAGCL